MNGMYMFLAALRWLRESFPFWERRNGTDHIIMATHDEGSCWVPNELRSAILLTHWAPLDYPRKSKSAWVSDRYSDRCGSLCTLPILIVLNVADRALCCADSCRLGTSFALCSWRTRNSTQYKSGEHLPHLFGAPCFDPKKDICVAGYKPASEYAASPLLGADAQKRDILFFLRGDVGKARLASYSNGVRQSLYRNWLENGWHRKYNILIGDSSDIAGSYSSLLARSRFCAVATGDGFSMRVEDAMLHGCVPVLIMDNILPVWDPHLRWEEFSVRVAEADIPDIPAILQALDSSGATLVRIACEMLLLDHVTRLVPSICLQSCASRSSNRMFAVHPQALQQNVAEVWHRFAWTSYFPFDEEIAEKRRLGHSRWQAAGEPAHASAPAPVWSSDNRNDAFGTLLQILYSKMQDGSGSARKRAAQ